MQVPVGVSQDSSNHGPTTSVTGTDLSSPWLDDPKPKAFVDPTEPTPLDMALEAADAQNRGTELQGVAQGRRFHEAGWDFVRSFAGTLTMPATPDVVLVPRSLVDDVLKDLGPEIDHPLAEYPESYHKLKALVVKCSHPPVPAFPPNTLNSEGAIKMTTTPCPSSQPSK